MPARPRGARWEENGWLWERRVTYSEEDGTIRPRNVRVVKVKVRKPPPKRCLLCKKAMFKATPKQKFCSARHKAYYHRGFIPKKLKDHQEEHERRREDRNAAARERYHRNKAREAEAKLRRELLAEREQKQPQLTKEEQREQIRASLLASKEEREKQKSMPQLIERARVLSEAEEFEQDIMDRMRQLGKARGR